MKEEFINKLRALFEEYDAVLFLEDYYEDSKVMVIDILENEPNKQTIYLGGEFKHDTPL